MSVSRLFNFTFNDDGSQVKALAIKDGKGRNPRVKRLACLLSCRHAFCSAAEALTKLFHWRQSFPFLANLKFKCFRNEFPLFSVVHLGTEIGERLKVWQVGSRSDEMGCLKMKSTAK